MESRDSRGELSKQIKLLDFHLKCIQSSKNMSFYRVSDRNRPIETIDGYDELVHRGPFRLNRNRRIVMDGMDLIPR